MRCVYTAIYLNPFIGSRHTKCIDISSYRDCSVESRCHPRTDFIVLCETCEYLDPNSMSTHGVLVVVCFCLACLFKHLWCPGGNLAASRSQIPKRVEVQALGHCGIGPPSNANTTMLSPDPWHPRRAQHLPFRTGGAGNGQEHQVTWPRGSRICPGTLRGSIESLQWTTMAWLDACTSNSSCS